MSAPHNRKMRHAWSKERQSKHRMNTKCMQEADQQALRMSLISCSKLTSCAVTKA